MQGRKVKADIMLAIVEYIEDHGYPPTIREIGEAVGMKSTSSVHAYVKDLIDDGKLETDEVGHHSRALRVPGYRFVKISQ